jgi:ADP-ribosyl-[dinitrogen reductase] hydrolase
VSIDDPVLLNRFRGCLIGLAVGDAVGTTVEFRPRGSFERLTDMIGGGVFRLRPGQWTDDTSMALCLAESLIECRGFDALDQMRRYCRWADSGHLSSTGGCFDIGGTTAAALARFRQTDEPFAGPTDPRTAGNGSIMRLAPVALAYFPDAALIERHAAASSRTTHGAAECLDACRLLGALLCRALSGQPKREILAGGTRGPLITPRIRTLATAAYESKSEAGIRGSGYVVESLEAALWCFAGTSSFEEAILAAANLGEDADTTAAVAGQLAGAFYGYDGIPSRWTERIWYRDLIIRSADELAALRLTGNMPSQTDLTS